MNPLSPFIAPIDAYAFGFLPYVKPHGMTSRDLVNRVQRRLRREQNDRKLKVGHTGTLDPLADGLVVIAVGAAARLTPWLLQHTKRYVARFELGASSSSGDLEETVTPLCDAPVPSLDQLQSVCHGLQGWMEQTPPTHSAIWVDGQRAYQRIRRGEQVEMPTRRVWIESIEILKYDYPHLDVDVRCGSGTYLRSLGIDIAARCQTAAVMTKLTRTEVGPFTCQAAVQQMPPNDGPPLDRERMLEGLTAMPGGRDLSTYIHNPMLGLGHLATLRLDDADAARVRCGLCVGGTPQLPSGSDVAMTGTRAQSMAKPFGEHGQTAAPAAECLAVDARGDLVSVLRKKNGDWAPYRVFACSRRLE